MSKKALTFFRKKEAVRSFLKKDAGQRILSIAYSVGHATDCVRTDVARSLWGRDAIQ